MSAPRSNLASLLNQNAGPLLLPSAHDALSARLIEDAGFKALSISGSSLLAARHALPDLGLVGLGEMAAATRDIVSATPLPCLADGDDGYGDAKAVARMVQVYERMGVAAITLEDQDRINKRPGQGSAVGLVDHEAIVAKIGAAVKTRDSGDFWIVGRTDAYTVHGLDEALRRAEAMLAAGADALFVAGVKDAEHVAVIGRTFSPTPLVSVHYGIAGWPNLTPAELGQMGYRLLVYPLALLPAVALLMRQILADLTSTATVPESQILLKTLTRQSSWLALESDWS